MWLYIVVAVSGAAVLGIEILGTRLLGPFYGVSLFLWSALITVTLLALSIGYLLGGRWADRDPRRTRLALLLVLAGAWFLAVPWLRHPLLVAAEPLGLRTAVLLVALVLFAPPLVLLGMVSPYAVRLRVMGVHEVGRSAGDLYAVSTVAGVISALLTGFWLIPNIGVGKLVLGWGLLLVATGGVVLAFSRRSLKTTAIGSAAILALTGASGIFLAQRDDAVTARDGKLIALRQSPYAEIRVVEAQDSRLLLIDGGIHTIALPGTWESGFRYAVALDLAKDLFPAPGRLLVIGLGGGSIVKSFARSGWRVDAVEIDPAVVALAREHFGLRPEEARIFTMDGRRYIRSGGDPYDLIVLDAFGSSSIPFHLVTREAFGLLARRLSTDGVLALNVETVGWKDPLLSALATTLGTQFRTVLALPLGEPPNVLGNVLLVASQREISYPEERLERPYDHLDDPYRHWVVVQRNHAWDNRYVPDTNPRWLLTDDRNPVDIWAERINREARKQLHEDARLTRAAW